MISINWVNNFFHNLNINKQKNQVQNHKTTSFLSRVFGRGNGRNPKPTPKFAGLFNLPKGNIWGIGAGWKLYANLFTWGASFLLTGITEFIEPIGFKGLDRYFL
jgi:hypothetical protein